MNSKGCIVASLPNLPIRDWDKKYFAILRVTSRTLSVVSVGENFEQTREQAYKDISEIANEAVKFRIFGSILDMQFDDELILRGHIRVLAAFCDARTYYVAKALPPKSVYVGICSSKPLTVKFVRIKEGL